MRIVPIRICSRDNNPGGAMIVEQSLSHYHLAEPFGGGKGVVYKNETYLTWN